MPHYLLSLTAMVTRFGKFLPPISAGLFNIGQNFESTLEFFYAVGQISIVVNCQILNNYLI